VRFQLTIPPEAPQDEAAVLTVEAQNWLTALKKALAQQGARQIPKGKALCEIRADGTIIVRNAEDGRTFFIKNLPAEPEPVVHEKRSVQSATSYPTMTYLEAELQEMRRPTRPIPKSNGTERSDVETSGHPCMTFNKAEIDRRLREHRQQMLAQRQQAAEAANAGAGPAGAVEGQERPVKFIQVVDVLRPKPDTLTTLRVDLDALRASADQGRVRTTHEKNAPEGFEWLQAPLEAVLSGSNSLTELADRTLRLSLAAVPSKVALFLLRAADHDGLRIISVVGGKYAQQVSIREKKGPTQVSVLASSGVSMALEGSSGQFSTGMLTSLLDDTPRNALMAAITSGFETQGALLLAESLASPTYESSDLSVASYIAGRVYTSLSSLMKVEQA